MRMTWRCVTCGRQIIKTPPVTIPTRSESIHMGPKCAKRAGLLRAVNPRVAVKVVRADIGQLDIFGENA